VIDQLQAVEHSFHKPGMRLLSLIGRQEWLDRPSYRFENALSFVFNAFGGARTRVTNALNGVWLGHPSQPPLASLATGAIGTTVALDALHALSGRPFTALPDARKGHQHDRIWHHNRQRLPGWGLGIRIGYRH